MGKCVSRQSPPLSQLEEIASHGGEHHQSVLTIALSREDLAQAHKIWQELTASNEYIAATSSRGQEQQQPRQPQQQEELVDQEPFYYTISRRHIESLYIDAPAESLTSPGCGGSVVEYSTCQEFLLQELLQAIETAEEEQYPARIRPEPQLQAENNGWLLAAGQAESKKQGSKSSRRHHHNANGNGNGNPVEAQDLAVHTKGTAMSFGFRKKLNGTPKKFKKLLEGGDKSATQTDTKDDNGNAAAPIHFEKVGAAAQKTATGSSQSVAGAAGARFGYRGAVPRPASTGLTAPSEESESETMANAQNNNNNNSRGAGSGPVLVSNLKRRSKSAHAGGRSGDGEPKIAQPKTLTFNLNQNTTIEYQRRQFFGEIADDTSGSGHGSAMGSGTGSRGMQPRYNYNNLASMHANVIVRPTPRPTPASYAKFTLQTVSLPRPEYPVAISLTATTPTTPSSSVQSPVPAHSTGARAKDTSTSSSSRQHPLTSVHVQPQAQQRHLDQKSVKQLTNNSTRRGFSGSREISADSGIASMDMALDSSSGSSVGSKRSRSRPRNLKMVMSGRHTFEVRDADDPPSSESNSFVEPLALPKLPTDGSQSIPLPLLGLVRSNTVLSRESYERRQAEGSPGSQDQSEEKPKTGGSGGGSDESESVDEEKLYLDSSTSEKSAKQQQSQSSVSSTWRLQAGESLAAQDCTSMSMSISSDTQAPENARDNNDKEEDMSLGLDEISLINTDMQYSTISSMTETPPKVGHMEPLLNMHLVDNREVVATCTSGDRPRSFNNALNESKFAELALASSSCLLLDDETSPTDSLVSSTEDSEEAAGGKLQKHKLNEERQQKDIDEIDIDEISPVLELDLDPPGSRSPISPGTPTHASHSLSLGSDCGNLIDDEIADQPALLCNSEAQEVATDTPTLMDTLTHTQTGSLRSLKSQSKARTALQQAIELSLRTPAAVRKAVMDRAESLDTLSPCESICSDDLMMDFDMNSSLDSIDHMANATGRSRSGSDLHRMGLGGQDMELSRAETEAELLSELERKGSDVMKELNTLLRGRKQRGGPRERISAQLPARATRLLNRSRLQDPQLTGNDSDNSLRSTHSGGASAAAAVRKRSTANSRASTASSTASLPRQRHLQQQHLGQAGAGGGGAGGSGSNHRCGGELHSSSDDLMLYDKSFRNAMLQDVLQFKKQLLRLRRILQEEPDFDLKPTETLNPFENDNVQLFAACGLDSKQLNDIDLASLTSSTTEDPLQELTDLRRQVVYLQGQVDDRDRTIRLQRDLIEQLEAEKRQKALANGTSSEPPGKELISMATQTERTRPLAIGAEGLSRSKPEYTSYTTHFPTLHLHDSTLAATTIIRHHQSNQSSSHQGERERDKSQSSCPALSQTRRHTIISTTLTNYNQQLAAASFPDTPPRRSSIGWEAATANASPASYKPVRITLIGEPLPLQNNKSSTGSLSSLSCSSTSSLSPQAQNGVKLRYPNGCQSKPSAHYQPLYNSNKMTNPTVTIV